VVAVVVVDDVGGGGGGVSLYDGADEKAEV